MAHSLTPAPATATLISTGRRSHNKSHFPALIRFQNVWACHQISNPAFDDKIVVVVVDRRAVTLGLTSAVLGLIAGDRSATAASRRPPPPPPVEKKDPNVSGVTAKILASKKRKEALKEAMAKQREKGKPVNE